jgi:hypothetical protein
MDQTEKLYIFCDSISSVPDRPRKFYPGTNRGRSWGFLALDPIDALWHVPLDKKQAALGEAMRPCGGSGQGRRRRDEEDEDDGAVLLTEEVEERQLKPNNLVPRTWHGLPRLFYEELLHVNQCQGVLDFTPGDGLMAIVALQMKPGPMYCGWCHTEEHAQMLRARLTDEVLKCMQQEGNPLL